LSFATATGKTYDLSVSAAKIQSFANVTYTITYDATKLQLIDLAAQTKQLDTAVGAVAGTPITITQLGSGVIKFTVNKSIPNGYEWSGVLTVLRFVAIGTGSATISVE